MPIRSFRNRETAAIFAGMQVRSLPQQIQARARSKPMMIHTVTDLAELALPPANRPESLKGTRAGQHSIRINAQWRICFRWEAPDAFDVEICDYHH